MEGRFSGSSGADQSELLLLIPSCLTDAKWRGREEELYNKIKRAAQLYEEDIRDGTARFMTELHLWRDYW